MARPKKDSTESNERKVTRPGWKPASRMANLKAPRGYTARWVDASDPSEISRYKEEGWVIMKPSDNRGTDLSPIDVNDETSVSHNIRWRGMIGMMLPNELKEAREEYMRQEGKSKIRGVMNDMDDGITRAGGTSYKPDGMQGRIVIE